MKAAAMVIFRGLQKEEWRNLRMAYEIWVKQVARMLLCNSKINSATDHFMKVTLRKKRKCSCFGFDPEPYQN
jgi:hypothetical protein